MFNLFKKKNNGSEVEVVVERLNVEEKTATKAKSKTKKDSDTTKNAKTSIGKKSEKKEKCIVEVMEKSGWTRKQVEDHVKDTRKRLGISYSDYNKYDFWNIPVADQEEAYAGVVERKERRKRFREQCIALAMEHRGWTREQAEEHLDATKKRTGMGYLEYRRYYFFNIPEEEQMQRYSEIRKSKEARSNRHGNETSKFIDYITGVTGWEKADVKEKVRKAKEYAGATLKDYYAFKFWEIDEAEQKTYFTQKDSNKISAKYDTNELHRDILLNKELSCIHFSDFLRRPWCINRNISFEEFKERFANEKKIVYKPLDGNGGLGICVFAIDDDTVKEVYEKIMGYSRGVVEGFVVQHADISRLTPNSVNTVRVVSVSEDVTGSEERKTDVAYVAMRIGSGKSCVDNFTDGGMVVGVDLEKGEIVTDGVTIDGTVFTHHPETNTKFRGFKIPYFKETLEMVQEAGKTISGYVGWDIAITETGPVLIEANIMPGNRILQMPYVTDRIGKRSVMERFL